MDGVQVRVCQAIGSLRGSSEEARLPYLTSGVPGRVVWAMGRFPEVLAMQLAGCRALLFLAGKKEDLKQRRLVAPGAREAVKEAMVRLTDDTMQTLGKQALEALPE